jgi:hypothetical protein
MSTFLSKQLFAALLAPLLLIGDQVLTQSGSVAGYWLAVHDTMAQAPDTAPITTSRTINLTQENRHVIKEIVLKDMEVKKAPDNVNVTIGDPVPQGVSVQPFPAEVFQKVPALKSHSFFVKGDQVVVVDPKDNTIADVVK